jgi:hypothetical protein
MLFGLRKGHSVKERKVLACQAVFGAGIFVETGTYLGEMVHAAGRAFGEIHSIELNPTLAKEAAAFFKGSPHISIHEGDSGLILRDVLAGLSGPAIFWLDAHYSAGMTAKSGTFGDTPILAELDTILAAWKDRSAILIDDARLFVGADGYPTIEAVQDRVRAKGLPLSCFVDADIIHIL